MKFKPYDFVLLDGNKIVQVVSQTTKGVHVAEPKIIEFDFDQPRPLITDLSRLSYVDVGEGYRQLRHDEIIAESGDEIYCENAKYWISGNDNGSNKVSDHNIALIWRRKIATRTKAEAITELIKSGALAPIEEQEPLIKLFTL